MREAVVLDHIIHKGLGDFHRCEWMFEGYEMRCLGEAIDDNQNGGDGVSLRKPRDEIHGEVCPHMGWDRKRLQQTRRCNDL